MLTQKMFTEKNKKEKEKQIKKASAMFTPACGEEKGRYWLT